MPTVVSHLMQFSVLHIYLSSQRVDENEEKSHSCEINELFSLLQLFLEEGPAVHASFVGCSYFPVV